MCWSKYRMVPLLVFQKVGAGNPLYDGFQALYHGVLPSQAKWLGYSLVFKGKSAIYRLVSGPWCSLEKLVFPMGISILDGDPSILWVLLLIGCDCPTHQERHRENMAIQMERYGEVGRKQEARGTANEQETQDNRTKVFIKVDKTGHDS